MSRRADIARAKRLAASWEWKALNGSIKKRHDAHVMHRALLLYAAAVEFELDRLETSAAIKAGERRANVAVPVTDQAIQEVHPFHGPTMERNDAKRHIAER